MTARLDFDPTLVEATCAACRIARYLDELIEVRDARSPRSRPFYVCRPDLGSACFRQAVGIAADHRIALAVPA